MISSRDTEPCDVAAQILIIDSDTELVQWLSEYLGRAGFFIRHFVSIEAVFMQEHKPQPVLILLDEDARSLQGQLAFKQLQQNMHAPIVFVSSLSSTAVQIQALELGAIDYITKPFDPYWVTAKVNTLLRWTSNAESQPSSTVELTLNAQRLQLSYRNKKTDLTEVEFAILTQLMSAPETIFSRHQIMQQAYDDHRQVDPRTIDSHIKKLRLKLRLICEDNTPIQTVYGRGYRYSCC